MIASSELRRAIGHFATGVTVVTSRGTDQEPVGTTANAVTSLSLEPPQLLVCLDRRSLTLVAISAYGHFAINVLAGHQQGVSQNFARSGGDASWQAVDHDGGHTGSPLLHGALAWLECGVARIIDAGDHQIVIGTVLRTETSDDDRDPLLFWRGAYARLETAA